MPSTSGFAVGENVNPVQVLYITSKPLVPFTLAPVPPPRFKHSQTSKVIRNLHLPSQPHRRRSHTSLLRSPRSPSDSFLSLTPSPTPFNNTSTVLYTGDSSPKSSILAVTPPFHTRNLNLVAFGYSVDITSYHNKPSALKSPLQSYTNTQLTVSHPITASKPKFKSKPIFNKSRSKSISNIAMGLSNLISRSSSNKESIPPVPSRRGSVPDSSKKDKEAKKREKAKAKALPIQYDALCELNGIFGDTRPPKGVVPHQDANGRLWRDRDEELEYRRLLKNGGLPSGSTISEPKSSSSSKWKMFGSRTAHEVAPTFDLTSAPVDASSSSSSDEEDRQREKKERRRHRAVAAPAPSGPDFSGYAFPAPPSHHRHAQYYGQQPPQYAPSPSPRADFFASSFAPVPVSSRRA